jgi:hypothetical protein
VLRRKFDRATLETPKALAALHKAEIEKWWPITKAARSVTGTIDFRFWHFCDVSPCPL